LLIFAGNSRRTGSLAGLYLKNAARALTVSAKLGEYVAISKDMTRYPMSWWQQSKGSSRAFHSAWYVATYLPSVPSRERWRSARRSQSSITNRQPSIVYGLKPERA